MDRWRTKEDQFLSTLSLRRATSQQPPGTTRTTYFYPRSPCGERPIGPPCVTSFNGFLSTLSLRRATVGTSQVFQRIAFLSTLSLRRATSQPRRGPDLPRISIHALLAESDEFRKLLYPGSTNFYPRSPCGERHQLYDTYAKVLRVFLSTLSLRRATERESQH